MIVTTSTRLLGVIGWPIAHSLSPEMQNAALKNLNLDFRYLAFAVAPENLRTAVEGARALGVRGLNVTVPHKENVMALCEPDEIARRVGAVNTLIFDEKRVRGSNTDVHGFEKMLEELGVRKEGRAVVLGAGGAARAVVAALQPHASEIVVCARSPRPFTVGGVEYEVMPRDAELRDCDLLVDATPRGLDEKSIPPDLSALPKHASVIDLVVRRETPLTRAAKHRGLWAAAGASMLLHQGAAAFEMWTGVPAPVEIMRAALDDTL